MKRLIKSFAIFAIIIAALINAVACQDVSFRTKETNESALTAFVEKEDPVSIPIASAELTSYGGWRTS